MSFSDLADTSETGLGSKLSKEDKETLATAIEKAIKFADESQYASISDLKAETQKLNTLVRQFTAQNTKEEGQKKKSGHNHRSEL